MADRRLLVWTFASFHAAGVTLAVVALGHAGDALSGTLPQFGTLPGFLGYAYLWGLSALATRWVLTADVLEAVLDGPLRTVLLRGTAAGGLVGLAALLGPLALVAIPDLVAGGGNPTAFALIGAVGGGIATVVGCVVGLAFALLDVAAVSGARALVGE